jgi:thioredoxin reductase (NADPH)
MSDVTVYGAPWCPDCRRAKKFLGEHRVHYEWSDIDQNPDALRVVEELQGGGRTIPTVVFSDGSLFVAPTNEQLARKLGLSITATRRFYDLAIIGGGPAGLAAAVYAAREGIDAVVVEQAALGGNAGTTERIDNYLGFPEGVGGAELAERFVAQAQRYGVELLSAVGVEGFGGGADHEDVKVRLGTGQEIDAHTVLIATGSSYRRLDIPGESELIGAGVHFCATCDGPFYRGAGELLIIGGGNSALEEGLFLSQFADRIRVVEFAPELRASRLLQDKVRQSPQFVIHLNTEITELHGRHRLESVDARDRGSGEKYTWHPAAAFVFIGLDPSSGFAGGTVELDRWGFVVTDDQFQTSVPGVFAAGDVRAGSTKQLASAVGEGVAALLMIRQYLQRHSHLARIDVNA